jgi:hypothetical protein
MTFADKLKALGKDVKNVALNIEKGFVALFGADVAKQFATASLAILKTALGQIVTQVVQDMSSSTLDSTSKREQAVVQILAIAGQQGIIVAESEVRLLIEIAVQFVEGKVSVASSTGGAATPTT